MRRASALLAVLVAALVACGRPSEKAPDAAGWRGARIETEADFERFVEDVVRSVAEPGLPPISPEGLAEIERTAGDRWPEALLAVLRGVHGGDAPVAITPSAEEDRRDPLVARLLERPAGSLDDELVSIVMDRDEAPALRRVALAALCRPESAGAVDALVDVVLDSAEDPEFREAVLLRLPRLDRELPERLDDLLWLPFHGLDERAAVVLATCGRPVAPSLLIDVSRRLAAPELSPAGKLDLVIAVARAAVRLAPDDEGARQALRRILTEGPWNRRHARRAVADAIQHWANAHPASMDSAFELDRAQAREAARRATVRAPKRITELAGRPDDEIDLPVAALVATDAPSRVTMERFERMVLLLRRDVARISAGGEPPRDAVLACLRRRLHGPRRRLDGIGTDGYATDLADVLRLQHGNCLGLTLLWVAVGERLDLPLRPVGMPGHTAVVWSDERGDVILETTAEAVPRAPEHYRTLEPLAVREGDSGDDLLRPISETDLLAGLMSNVSAELRAGVVAGRRTDPQAQRERAARLARDALVLAPDDVNACVNLALAVGGLGKDGVAEAHAVLDAAAARDDLTPLDRLVLAHAFYECGRRESASRLLAPVAERFPDDARVRTLRRLLSE